jgi:outer membrane receptor protein involved in Fe transport
MSRGFGGPNSIVRLYDGGQILVGQGTMTFPFDSWTVERLEYLAGPASVLYGSGAIGGALNVIPRRLDRITSFASRSGVEWIHSRGIGRSRPTRKHSNERRSRESECISRGRGLTV